MFYPLGDMLLTPAQLKAAEDIDRGDLLSRAASNSIKKWDGGIVPYQFEASYGEFNFFLRTKLKYLRTVAVWAIKSPTWQPQSFLGKSPSPFFSLAPPLSLCPSDRYPRKKTAILRLVAVLNKLLEGCIAFIRKEPWHEHFVSFDHQSGQIGPCSSPSTVD